MKHIKQADLGFFILYQPIVYQDLFLFYLSTPWDILKYLVFNFEFILDNLSIEILGGEANQNNVLSENNMASSYEKHPLFVVLTLKSFYF